MHLRKVIIIFVIAACLFMNAAAKRKGIKNKLKKAGLSNIVAPPCGCQNPLADILNCGCRGPIIDPALAPLDIGIPACRGSIIEPPLAPFSPLEIALSGCKSPIIDIPNYRYAEPLELNPLGCLFPSIEIPNYGLLSAPTTLPSVEYFTAVDLPCGCPGPKCGCRSPAVKLPAYPREYVAAIDVPGCGCSSSAYPYGPIASVIELPSYAPAPVIPIPAGRPGCGCKGPEYQILPCQGPCSCPGIPVSSCGYKGPCGCAGVPPSCGCPGPCGCPGLPLGLLPSVDASPCGCGLPGCDCGQYLRQITLQPPFL